MFFCNLHFWTLICVFVVRARASKVQQSAKVTEKTKKNVTTTLYREVEDFLIIFLDENKRYSFMDPTIPILPLFCNRRLLLVLTNTSFLETI